jgi:hypothetical protein
LAGSTIRQTVALVGGLCRGVEVPRGSRSLHAATRGTTRGFLRCEPRCQGSSSHRSA